MEAKETKKLFEETRKVRESLGKKIAEQRQKAFEAFEALKSGRGLAFELAIAQFVK